MAMPGSSFTPTSLSHEDNLEVRQHPRANALQLAFFSKVVKLCKRDGSPFLFTPINKRASKIKEIILDVRFPKQKNLRVTFQCGDRAPLTSEHVVLLTATLPPQIRSKIGLKSCREDIRVIQLLETLISCSKDLKI
ncbi:UNVERIFIED_CONTAM: hypothetical protein NCL1_37055 [Trichonephila clavipes]